MKQHDIIKASSSAAAQSPGDYVAGDFTYYHHVGKYIKRGLDFADLTPEQQQGVKRGLRRDGKEIAGHLAAVPDAARELDEWLRVGIIAATPAASVTAAQLWGLFQQYFPGEGSTMSGTPGTSTIMELMLLDDEEQKQRLLATLHKLVDGKKGKHVALVFLICEKCGLMNKPTHNILTSIFGDIGAKSGYNNYYSKGLSYYKQEQIKGVETHILPFVNGH